MSKSKRGRERERKKEDESIIKCDKIWHGSISDIVRCSLLFWIECYVNLVAIFYCCIAVHHILIRLFSTILDHMS